MITRSPPGLGFPRAGDLDPPLAAGLAFPAVVAGIDRNMPVGEENHVQGGVAAEGDDELLRADILAAEAGACTGICG